MTNMQSMKKWCPTIQKYSSILDLVREGSYDYSVGLGSFYAGIKVSAFVNFEVDQIRSGGREGGDDDEEISGLGISVYCCSGGFYLLSCRETLIEQVVCLKRHTT